MSMIQGILNRRLGIQKEIQIEKEKVQEEAKSEPKPEKVQEEAKPEPKPEPKKQRTELPKIMAVPKKNARGAGRKKNNEEELEKKRVDAVNRLTKGSITDLETVNELKDNVPKEQLVEEIKNSRRKLKLLNDALLFSDK